MNKIIRIMQEANVVGATAAFIRSDSTVECFSYGVTDISSQRPATSQTIYRVASLSKMVTATALMQLWEKHRFSLDCDISKYLGYTVFNPNFPDTPITCRHLLTHTSSILDDAVYNDIIADTEQRAVVTLYDMLHTNGSLYNQSTFGCYQPGTAFNYSNFGSVIIGSLVELFSGQDFALYCHDNIFKPLGMECAFGAVLPANEQNVATLYRSDIDNPRQFIPSLHYNSTKQQRNKHPRTAPLGTALYCGPAGNLYTCIPDFAKFMIAHLNDGCHNSINILQPDTARLMHSLQWQDDNNPKSNTLGGNYKQKGLHFHIIPDLVTGRRLIGHSGDAYGLISGAYLDKEKQCGIIFAISGGNYGNEQPFLKIERKLIEELFNKI